VVRDGSRDARPTWTPALPPGCTFPYPRHLNFSQVHLEKAEHEVEVAMNEAERSRPTGIWTEALGEEDLVFVRRFVLASGSLKAIAREYGVSYPTIRLRLDRLIQKIRVFEDLRATGCFERRLRMLFAEGRIDLDALRTLLVEHQKELDAISSSGGARRGGESP
jgi:hypothetical protein